MAALPLADAWAADGDASVPKTGEVVRVATRVLPPFVMDERGKLNGFSIELWERIAERIGVTTEYVVRPNVTELLSTVRDGKADLAISAISITAQREAQFDFSHPMYDSGLAILVQVGAQHQSFMDIVIQWSTQLLPAMGLGFILVMIPAHLIWFIERRGESDLPVHRSYYPGIVLAAYWVATLMGGQADPMPTRRASRVVAVIGIYVGLVFVAYFTAYATSMLTVQQLKSGISSPSDLIGKTVASVEGSTAAKYLATLRVDTLVFPTVAEAIASTESGKTSAVVYDSPVLRYFASHDGRGRMKLAGPTFREEKYGIAFKQNSTLRKRVNEELLRLREDGTYGDMQVRWFGTEDNS
ncbi:Glutamine ABC transporter periplasmic glutamine-binding protein [Paramagnetospirillum magnetotacticum MS-1]|uniref:Glutamine ABC transporter periplasmic glutamine-binding protein n=1 Tax=Paramagnetospirillum magnetotacticum MS-1 TaxID=272627 RepID=A0A0C2YZC7_PARME|nr:Glutamine ABC transporter periplasmic glutamine-binding protein [Paramagnetospirillum magnetotacticum MS-1]